MGPLTRAASGCLVVAVVTVVGASGCGKSCDDGPGEPATVYVIDAATHQHICDSSVLVHKDGEWLSVPTKDCTGFFLVSVEPGLFDVVVRAPGYAEQQLLVRVTADDCDALHVQGDGPRNGHPGYANSVTVAMVLN